MIIDDTPEVVTLSGLSIRRGIAMTQWRAFSKDGRIHPARIENWLKESVATGFREYGEAAT